MSKNEHDDASPLGRLKSFFVKPAQAGMPPQVDRLHLATCVILLEVAQADQEFLPAERQHIVAVLRERFSLSRDQAEELIGLATEQRGQSADLWHFTHELNKSCSREEKFEIFAEVWRIIYMDKTLNRHEDYLVHKLAKLLNLDQREMIDVKMQVRREMIGDAGEI